MESMEAVGRRVLGERVGEVEEGELLMGFHWPPLTSIAHLHLHIIYPASSLGFFSRHLVFKPGLLFVQV